MAEYRVYLTGVGGQGTLLATKILAEAAIHAGYRTIASEVHGMAQRGGIVESTVLIGQIESPIISNGEADVLVGFEPLETYRAMAKCSKDSIVISNTVPIMPFSVAIGKAVYPDVARLLDQIGNHVARLDTLDAQALALEAGTAIATNVVMLGALARTQALPVSKEDFQETIRTKTKERFLDINLKAFDLGYTTS